MLLVNQILKKKYDEALQNIEKKKDALLKKLKQLSGLTGRTDTPETEILRVFSHKSILPLFEILESPVSKTTDGRLSTVVYGELFNEKTISLLESGEIKAQLKEYIEKYNDLIEKSPVLNKSFNHYHAKTIHKNLTENGFFAAKHSVNLFNGTTKEEFSTPEKLEEKIEEEKKKILSNDDLLKKFEAIDKKLNNAELRKFRDYLFDNKDIVSELADYKEFQKRIWLTYLANQADLFNDLLQEFKSGKKEIESAIAAAKREKTDWEEVVNIFNKRFSVPFKIEVSNQEDVILKGSSPNLIFIFIDPDESARIDRTALLKVLSQGEKRALYILNILFDLNVRIKEKIETILIVDDIADSFDYKNKYAIVEYLKEVSETEGFFAVFLTHNFDFHRTISGRLNIRRGNRLFAVKNGNNLRLAQEKYQKDPFDHWKENLTNRLFTISAIPFVRNLAQYSGWTSEYSKLTSLLHLKPDTRNIKLQDLQLIYSTILRDQSGLTLQDSTKTVIDCIYEVAEDVLSEADEEAELESKIVLSIAIRLQAEDYMIKQIADPMFSNNIEKNQTMQLLKKYKEKFPKELPSIALLEQVNLMTPENIHLNSLCMNQFWIWHRSI